VVVLAIKLQLARKLVLLRVTIVVKEAMSLEIAKHPQKPKSVTSVVRKATSLVIALVMPIVEEVPTVEEEAEVEVENVINVVKSGISLVHANLVVEVEEGTVHLVVGVVRRRLVIHVAA